MALVKEMASKPCSMAFSEDGDYLAVGVRCLTASDYPALRMLRTAETLSTDELLGVEAFYRSPAGFARVAWSKPGEGSSGGGLIAGGLVNGTVAVWDPVDIPLLDRSEGNTTQGSFSIQMDNLSRNLTKGYKSERGCLGDEVYNSLKRYNPDVLRGDANEGTVIIEDYVINNPEPIRKFAANDDRTEITDIYNGSNKMAALFCRHTGPVRALAFSPHSPNYLASGASDGRILIWDLAKTYCHNIPTSEYAVSKAELSFIAWNPCMSNVIATSSCKGETVVMDLRSKITMFSNWQTDGIISTCQWAPLNPNVILTANETCFNSSTFNLWDMRKATKPIRMFGNEIPGANHICFSPIDGDNFLASTNDDIYTWSLKDEQVVGRLLCGTSCGDVQYRGKSDEVFAASAEGGIRVYRWDTIDNSDCSDSIQ